MADRGVCPSFYTLLPNPQQIESMEFQQSALRDLDSVNIVLHKLFAVKLISSNLNCRRFSTKS